MIDDFRKSINSILYQRVTSPFWGALTFSWVIWNWEIFYLTLFISSTELEVTKIEYIKDYLQNNYFNLIYGPIITLILILGILPFISNGAYWLSLLFKNWKVDKKRVLENKIPLTIEESIKLRNELLKQEEAFDKINKKKNGRILELSSQVKKLEANNIDLENSVENQKKEKKALEYRVQNLLDRVDFRKIFKKVSVYKLSNDETWKFEIINQNEIQFTNENNYRKFDLFSIKNNGSQNFVILMYPRNQRHTDEFEFRLLKLNRTKKIHEFEGTEIRVQKNLDSSIICDELSVKIHDLL